MILKILSNLLIKILIDYEPITLVLYIMVRDMAGMKHFGPNII